MLIQTNLYLKKKPSIYECAVFVKKTFQDSLHGSKSYVLLPSPLSTALFKCVRFWMIQYWRWMNAWTNCFPSSFATYSKHGAWRMLEWPSVNLKWSFHPGEMAHLCPMMIRTLTSKNSHYLRRELSSQGSPRMLQDGDAVAVEFVLRFSSPFSW